MGKPLNPRQTKFVQLYLADPELNATRAYEAAGYRARGKAAEVCAAKLLKNPSVAAAIEEAMAERAERAKVKADDVLRELIRVGFSNVTDVATFGADGVTVTESDKLSDDAKAAIAEVSETRGKDGTILVKVKLHSKVQTLEMLARHLGMFPATRTILEGDEDKPLKFVVSKLAGQDAPTEDEAPA